MPQFSASDDWSTSVWANLDNGCCGDASEEFIYGWVGPFTGAHHLGLDASTCASSSHVNWWFRDDSNQSDSLTCSGTAMTANTWHHFAFVHDDTAGTNTLYMDGTQVAQDSSITGTGSNNLTDDVQLGICTRYEKSGEREFQTGLEGFNWDGEVAEMAVWDNYTLSATDIEMLANSRGNLAPLQIAYDNLEFYSPLDGSAEAKNATDPGVFKDYSKNGHTIVANTPQDWQIAASQNRFGAMGAGFGPADGSSITYDNSEGNNTNDPDGSSASLSAMTIANGSGNDRLVICSTSTENSTTISDATFDSTSGTELGDYTFATNGTIALYYWLDSDLPATSGDYTVTFTYAASVNDRFIFCSSLTGVDQVAPLADWNGCTDGTCQYITTDVPIPPGNGAWVYSHAHHGGTTTSAISPDASALNMNERVEVAGQSGRAAISVDAVLDEPNEQAEGISYP